MRALRRWPVACRCYEAGPTGFGLNFPLNTGHRSETFFPLRTAKKLNPAIVAKCHPNVEQNHQEALTQAV